MREFQRRDRESSRRETEKMSAELIVNEMASAVRVLGGDGPALAQNNRASRLTGLPVATIERLRWKKIKRPFADLADSVREALRKHNEESISRAKHELYLAQQQAAVIAARLTEIDGEFYGPEIDRLRNLGNGAGPPADRVG